MPNPTAQPPSPTKPLVRALKGLPTEHVPFWFMRQAGRYLPEYRELRARAKDFLAFCYSPSLAAEATLQPVRRYGMDGAIVFSDILVIPDALGQKVGFESGHGPVLAALAGAADVGKLSPNHVTTRLSPVYDALALTRTKLATETTLIGFAGAPWTIACYMIEGRGSATFAKAKSWVYGRRPAMEALTDVLVEAIAEHLIAQANAGAEALQIFDSWAGVLAEAEFVRWSIAPTARIVARVKAAHPHVPIVGFPNRCGAMLGVYARDTGIDAVQIDASVPLGWARSEVPAEVAIQGNLDPQLLAVGGPPMLTDAARICDILSAGRFVFNLGHGIVPETPPENVAALSAFLKQRDARA